MRDPVYAENVLTNWSTWISLHKLTNGNKIVNEEQTVFYYEIIIDKFVLSLLWEYGIC